jgi:hypothetical protein
MRHMVLSVAIIVTLASFPHPGQAQVSGVAFAALTGDILIEDGTIFHGPWRVTATGIDIRYWVVCIDTNDDNHKVPGQVVASVPNGSTLAQIRTIAATAVSNFCAAGNITVPLGAVILPAVQFGQ